MLKKNIVRMLSVLVLSLGIAAPALAASCCPGPCCTQGAECCDE